MIKYCRRCHRPRHFHSFTKEGGKQTWGMGRVCLSCRIQEESIRQKEREKSSLLSYEIFLLTLGGLSPGEVAEEIGTGRREVARGRSLLFGDDWGRMKQEQIKEETRKAARVRRLREKYGLSVEDFASLLIAQDYRCAICGAKQGTNEARFGKGHAKLCVDHDHFTGKVIGLLCTRCNFAIESFRRAQDPAVLATAFLSYLKRTGVALWKY